MKSIVKWIGLFALLFILSGCGGGGSDSSTDVVQVTPDTITEKDNVVMISIMDSSTGEPAENATVELVGTALDIEDNPMPKTVKTDNTGLISFYSKEGENVKVLVSKDGYISTGTEVNVTEGINDKTVELIKFDPLNTPSGLLMKEEKVATENGIVLADKEIELEGNLTKLLLPEGTKLLTASGKEAVGEVKIQVAFYDSNSTEYFPGGLTVSVASTPEGGSEEVNFISAGFTSIEMVDSEGNSIKSFENGSLEVGMRVPRDTINPMTGEVVKAGDTIPIWSYDVEKGTWAYAGKDGTVIDNGDPDNFVVLYEAEHLSYWNLDWHRSPVCTSHVEIENYQEGILTYLEIRGRGFYRRVYDYRKDGSYTLLNTPKTMPLTFTLKYNGETKDQKYYPSLQENGCNISLNLGNIPQPEPAQTLKVYEQCSNGLHKKAIPYVPVYLLQQTYWWRYAGMTNTSGEVQADMNNIVYIYASAYGRGYTNNYLFIKPDQMESNELIFIFGPAYESYCTPTGSTGGS